MFDWWNNLWTRLRAPTARRPLPLLRGRYDAAVTSAANRRHWAAADDLSADAAASPEVRRILRNRARYEIANNSYARGIVLTLANEVIGTGPRLQLLTPDERANRQVERLFYEWTQAVNLAEKLRTMRVARIEDGEGFALLTNNPRLSTPVSLDLRLVEADQVTTPDLSFTPRRNSVDGILFDRHGNPIEYHILREHPGDLVLSLSQAPERVPAEAVIHFFRRDRPGQSRGIPEITPALPLFAQLRRFTLAVLGAAETAADFAGILYTDAPAGGEAETIEPMDAIELEARALLTMPGGWRMAQMRAEHPNTSYAEFKREILNEIVRCLCMPFNIAAGTSTGLNYASGRLDHQTFARFVRVDQACLSRVVLDRIFQAWMHEAVLIDGLLPPSLRLFDSYFPHQWFFDGNEHVDPAKEANAQATRLANYTTTLADEYARRGQDWQTQLEQRAKEKHLMRSLGLTEAESLPAPDEDDEADDDAEEPVRQAA